MGLGYRPWLFSPEPLDLLGRTAVYVPHSEGGAGVAPRGLPLSLVGVERARLTNESEGPMGSDEQAIREGLW